MNNPPNPTQHLQQAIASLLRPLVRLCIRMGVPFGVFEEVSKRVYVEVAYSDFNLPGKKPSASRASILSGLTRKDVKRLMDASEVTDSSQGEQLNRAARVLTGWVRDEEFHDSHGEPKLLTLEGPQSFDTLVKRYSGDMPTRAILDELLRVGAVQSLPGGQLALLTSAYVPQNSTSDKLHMLGSDVADLITTIDHNIQYGAQDPRFQRKVMYHAIPADELAGFRRLSALHSQALLEKLDRWLADIDAAAAKLPADTPRARVGVGIYYFEEPKAPTSASESDTP